MERRVERIDTWVRKNLELFLDRAIYKVNIKVRPMENFKGKVIFPDEE